MRLINYLVFVLLTLLSFPALADVECTSSWGSSTGNGSSINGACSSLAASVTKVNSSWAYEKSVVKTETSGECYLRNSAGAGTSVVPVSCTKIACPTGKEGSIKWWADRSLPSQTCINKCSYIKSSVSKCVQVSFEGGKNGTESCDGFTSTGAECTQPDPDPDSQPKPPKPPMDPSKCKNASGADGYCKKPDDQACPTGYKQAMFNGQQICVKDSSNTPNPNDPTNQPNPPSPNPPTQPPSGCANGAQYCDNPPNEQACPSGYYRTFYKGQEICVKNNPDPNSPNPNDPNTNPNATPNPPTTPNPNPNPTPNPTPDTGNGLGGEFCEKGGKAVCDTLKDIKDFFTKEPTTGEMQSQSLQIQQEQVTSYQRQEHVRFGQYCPFQVTTEKVGLLTVEKDLTWICTFGYQAKPYIIAIGYLGALIYLLIGLRSKD